jgi:superfamily II DNA or RNA helicase
MSGGPPLQAVIRQHGPAIDVSADGLRPLPAEAYDRLLPALSYQRKVRDYGPRRGGGPDDGFAPRRRSQVYTEHVRLYRFDRVGRLMCGAGYTDRIYAALRALGYQVGRVDLRPGAGPDRLEPRWGRLDRHPEFAWRPGDVAALADQAAAGGPVDTALARRVKQRELLETFVRRARLRLFGVAQAPPGFGKTTTLAALAVALPRARIAIVTPGQDNGFKTYHHLLQYSGNVGMRGHGETSSGRVTVFSLQSLHHVPDDVDLLVVDEADTALADRASSELARVAPVAVRLGLTATPEGRLDGTDARMEGLLGPVVYRMTWPEAVRFGMVVPIEIRWINTDFDVNPVAALSERQRGQDWLRKKVGIWAHEARNQALAAVARRHPDDQVLYLVEKIEHALELARFLPDFALVYGQQDADYFDRFARRGLVEADFVPLDRAGREALRRQFAAGELRKVIATDCWARGVSFDALAVEVRCDGRASPRCDEQLPGRTSRVHAESGKAAGIVYDCTDGFDPGFQSAGRRRRANYGAKGWHQTNA